MFGKMLNVLLTIAGLDGDQSLELETLRTENARLRSDLGAAHQEIGQLRADYDFYYRAYTERNGNGHHQSRRTL